MLHGAMPVARHGVDRRTKHVGSWGRVGQFGRTQLRNPAIGRRNFWNKVDGSLKLQCCVKILPITKFVSRVRQRL